MFLSKTSFENRNRFPKKENATDQPAASPPPCQRIALPPIDYRRHPDRWIGPSFFQHMGVPLKIPLSCGHKPAPRANENLRTKISASEFLRYHTAGAAVETGSDPTPKSEEPFARSIGPQPRQHRYQQPARLSPRSAAIPRWYLWRSAPGICRYATPGFPKIDLPVVSSSWHVKALYRCPSYSTSRLMQHHPAVGKDVAFFY